jgi:hypothetical protein
MRGRQVAGVVLVGVGVALLVVTLTGVGGELIVLLGGLAFLASHLATRAYGLLVPGGILTGVGAAMLLDDLSFELGLGAGFVLIVLVQLVTGAPREAGWWWPLIPGGILVTLGVASLLDERTTRLVLPGVLIVLGLVSLLSARGAAPSDPGGTEADAGPDAAPDAGPDAGLAVDPTVDRPSGDGSIAGPDPSDAR